MDMSHCNELITLADSLNFSKAAKQLFIAQSTLSKHVALVEKEVGFRIFERNTTRVELTDAGAAYLKHLKISVKEYKEDLREGRECQRNLKPRIKIVGPFMNANLFALVYRAQRQCPSIGDEIELSVSDMGVRDSSKKILDRSADVAIAFRYSEQERNLYYEHLLDMPFGIACPKSHPFATKKTLRFEDIQNTHLISYPLRHRTGYHEFVKSVCLKHQIDTEIEYAEEDSLCFPNTKNSIVFGVYYPEYKNYGNDLISRPLDDMRSVFDVCAVRRKNEASPAILAFFENLVQQARKDQLPTRS